MPPRIQVGSRLLAGPGQYIHLRVHLLGAGSRAGYRRVKCIRHCGYEFTCFSVYNLYDRMHTLILGIERVFKITDCQLAMGYMNKQRRGWKMHRLHVRQWCGLLVKLNAASHISQDGALCQSLD